MKEDVWLKRLAITLIVETYLPISQRQVQNPCRQTKLTSLDKSAIHPLRSSRLYLPLSNFAGCAWMNPKILVIEDNPIEQFVLKQLVEKFDYEAHVVFSGEEAIATIEAENFSAILLDLTLPGIDGLECARRIRQMESPSMLRLPIIAITARAELNDRIACEMAGIDDYLSKPFDPEELRKMLLRHLYQPNQPNLKILRRLEPEDVNKMLAEIIEKEEDS